jgi:hypothetical protein
MQQLAQATRVRMVLTSSTFFGFGDGGSAPYIVWCLAIAGILTLGENFKSFWTQASMRIWSGMVLRFKIRVLLGYK